MAASAPLLWVAAHLSLLLLPAGAISVTATAPAPGRLRDGGSRGLARFLASEAERLGSPELSSLAQLASAAVGVAPPGAAAGDLDRVKGMIRHMLATMTADHARETSHGAFCKGELSRSKAKLSKLGLGVQRATADHDKLTAEIAALADKTADLRAADAEARNASAVAAQRRVQERTAFEAAEAVSSGFEKRVALGDAEARRSLEYERKSRELDAELARNGQAEKHNERQAIGMKRQESEAAQDLRALQEQLAAAEAYDQQIKRQCVARPESHEERAQRRTAVIASLKDAFNILSGDDALVLSQGSAVPLA